MFCCQSISLLRHSLDLKGCHYRKKKKKLQALDERPLSGSSLLSSSSITSVSLSSYYLALEKKLKRAIVFLIPSG